MNKNILISILVLVLGIGAYLAISNKKLQETPSTINQNTVTSGENSQPGNQVHDMPAEPAAVMARKDLAAKLSVDEKSIIILKITDETWTDGCLGLGGAAESCLQALVPGFRVEMLAKEKVYFYRTDKTGAVVRAEVK